MATISMERIEKRLAAAFAVVVLLLAGVSVVAWRNVRLAAESSDWVNHTHALIVEVENLQSSLFAGETAMRDYLLTSQERALADARVLYSEALESLAIAKALARSDPADSRSLAGIELLVSNRVEFARQAAQVAAGGDAQARSRLMQTTGSDTSLAELRRQAGQLRQTQEQKVKDRDTEAYLRAQATRWTVISGLVLNAMVLAFTGWLVRDDLRARRLAAQALHKANETLEARVAERTSELTEANRKLTYENLERQWQAQAMEHQARYNNLIIHAVDDIILVTTKMLKITRSTPATARHLGMDFNELAGQPLSRFIRPAETGGRPEDLAGRIGAALKLGHEMADTPVIITRPDGRELRGSLRMFPLRDRDHVVGGAVAIRLQADSSDPISARP